MLRSHSTSGAYDDSTQLQFPINREEVSTRHRTYGPLQQAADAVLSTLVITPIIIMYWAGTWELMDIYLHHWLSVAPGLTHLAAWATGLVLLTAMYHAFPYLDRLDMSDTSWVYVVVSRVFIVVAAFQTVANWHGAWGMADLYLPATEWTAVSLLVAMVVVIGCRATCNLRSCPFVFAVDLDEGMFKALPRFKTQIDRPARYTLDVFFTVVFLQTLCVVVWRNTWQLMDIYIYPDDKMRSYLYCCAVGCACAVALFGLQRAVLLKVACHAYRSSRTLGLVFEMYVHLLVYLSSILIWRGSWGLVRDYIVSGNLERSWLFHAMGTALVLLAQVGSSFMATVCGVDGECSQGNGVLFPMQYTKVFVAYHQRFKIPVDDNTGARAPLLPDSIDSS